MKRGNETDEPETHNNQCKIWWRLSMDIVEGEYWLMFED